MAAKRSFRTFLRDERGAVAATYALALFALVAIAGMGFDYARLVMVDTELQDAADAAALAAATQLNGDSQSISRANAAISNYFANSTSSVVNRTLFANDGSGTALTGVTTTYYTDYNSSTDAFGSVTTSGATAKVVNVQINARKAFFALTPLVGAVTSGTAAAQAAARMDAGVCKNPPMMMCGPSDGSIPAKGTGILLKEGGSGQWYPGEFGYLAVQNDPGAAALKSALAGNSNINQCTNSTTVTSQTGNISVAGDYLNTRFDLYSNPLSPSDCVPGTGAFCPAKNVRDDLIYKEVYAYNSGAAAAIRPTCGSTAAANVTKTVTAQTSIPSTSIVSGFSRDLCHIAGTCSNIGTGVWNVAGYYATHPYLPAGLSTRYDIYKWELANSSSTSSLSPLLLNPLDTAGQSCNSAGKNCKPAWTNYCQYPSPQNATASTAATDRRVLTVALVDCSSTALTGGSSKPLPVKDWLDVFLTEPAVGRTYPYATTKDQIYVEVIGETTTAGGLNAFKYYARNKAVLVR